MRSIRILTFIFLFFSFLSCDPLESKNSSKEDDFGYKAIFTFLTSAELGGRYSGSAGAMASADYISRFLDGKTEMVDASNELAEMSNVIFTSYGTTDTMVVIGAHYDAYGFNHRAAFPGADDNISGVSVLLKVASSFLYRDAPHKYTYVFCFWDGEEIGRYGSRQYVSDLADRNKVKLYINVDTCGSDKAYRLGVQCDKKYPSLQETMNRLSNRIGVETTDYAPTSFTTDCEPFDNNDIPFVNVGCLTIPAYLHSSADTVDKISFSQLHRIQLALYDFLNSL